MKITCNITVFSVGGQLSLAHLEWIKISVCVVVTCVVVVVVVVVVCSCCTSALRPMRTRDFCAHLPLSWQRTCREFRSRKSQVHQFQSQSAVFSVLCYYAAVV